MFLFRLSHPKLLGNEHHYPRQITTPARPWPNAVLKWANPKLSSSPTDLSNHKLGYFMNPNTPWAALGGKEKVTSNEGIRYRNLFKVLYNTLWVTNTTDPKFRDENNKVEPDAVIKALEEYATERISSSKRVHMGTVPATNRQKRRNLESRRQP